MRCLMESFLRESGLGSSLRKNYCSLTPSGADAVDTTFLDIQSKLSFFMFHSPLAFGSIYAWFGPLLQAPQWCPTAFV